MWPGFLRAVVRPYCVTLRYVVDSLIFGQFSQAGLQVRGAFPPLAGCACEHEAQCGEFSFFRSSSYAHVQELC